MLFFIKKLQQEIKDWETKMAAIDATSEKLQNNHKTDDTSKVKVTADEIANQWQSMKERYV